MWLIIAIICEFTLDLSGNGLDLTIKGPGSIDSTITRKKGSYNTLQKVTIIGADELKDSSFQEFVSMREIVLPSVMSYIGAKCFYYCHCLESIVIPEGIKKILSDTFSHCYKLGSISIPKSLTFIDSGDPFYATPSHLVFEINEFNQYFSTDKTKRYLLNKNGSNLYKVPSSSECIIPSTVLVLEYHCSNSCHIRSLSFVGSKVEVIKSWAIVNEELDEVILPNSIKILESNFFSIKVNKLTLPNSLEQCGPQALSSITINSELNIDEGSNFFKKVDKIVYDYNLTTVVFIPPDFPNVSLSNDLQTITQKIILNHNLEWVNIKGWSSKYQSYKGIVYNDNFASLYACPGGLKNAEIIENCTSILSQSFINSLIETVRMPDGLKTIGFDAFDKCKMFRSTNIPPKLEEISSWAFVDCTMLKIDGSFPGSLRTFEGYAFRGVSFDVMNMSQCKLLKTIPTHSFYGRKIGKLLLPPNIISIQKNAFYSCSIKSINFPPFVQLIDESSFQNCQHLTTVIFDDISNSVLKTIGLNAFSSTNISSIELPANLATLSDGSFRNCVNLKSIKLNGALDSIGFEVIKGCSILASFDISNGVELITEGAFSGATGLQNFVDNDLIVSKYSVSDGILFTDKGVTLFAFPAGRKSGIVKKGVSRIAGMAFRECTNLASLTFETGANGEGINRIGSFTFYGCTALKSVLIPGSIQCIEENSFNGCTSLQKVGIGKNLDSFGELKLLNKSLFEGCQKLETLHVSINGLKSIDSRCLFGCCSLSSISIPSSLESIGDSAFDGCVSISDVTLEGIKNVGVRAFGGCKGLSKLQVGASIESIDETSFDECVSLNIIIYCGNKSSAFKGNVFKDVKADFAFVRQDYIETTLGGLPAHRVLDEKCNMPSVPFSNSFKEFTSWITLSAEIINDGMEDLLS